jgi:hypothetical protein
MKNLKIKACSNCPFITSVHDDFVVGSSKIENCGLSKHMGLEHDQISLSIYMYGKTTTEGGHTPDWCPIRDGLMVNLEDDNKTD